MVDRQFSDSKLAALYDATCPWELNGDYDFYLDLVLSAPAVLDVGCGTGALLHRARESGHEGRLCGLDPAVGMLEQARKRQDIDWILGDVASTSWDQEFDLVVMTGHAFQVLVEDSEIRNSLTKIRSALTNDGKFAFETRNPSAQAWKQWTADNWKEVSDSTGAVVRTWNEVDTPVEGDLVSFTTKFVSAQWDQPELSRSTLRFLSVDALATFLDDAGLTVKQQFGNWDRSPLTETSPEIITIAAK